MALSPRKWQTSGEVDFLLWITLGISGREPRHALHGQERGSRYPTGVSISIIGRRDVDCPICGAVAERTATAIDRVSIACPICGEFDVARTVVASGQLQGLALEERLHVLDKARRSADPSARPMITPYLLA